MFIVKNGNLANGPGICSDTVKRNWNTVIEKMNAHKGK